MLLDKITDDREIRANQVRLVDENGNMLGVVNIISNFKYKNHSAKVAAHNNNSRTYLPGRASRQDKDRVDQLTSTDIGPKPIHMQKLLETATPRTGTTQMALTARGAVNYTRPTNIAQKCVLTTATATKKQTTTNSRHTNK